MRWSFLLGFGWCFKPSFKSFNIALLAVCCSQSDSSELLLVTPLAFSDLALAHLGGTLLMGGSGVEVLLICAIHCSLTCLSWMNTKNILFLSTLSDLGPKRMGLNRHLIIQKRVVLFYTH